ncbi:MAG: protein kinase [Myxococcota bacterium]|nr:protein kinase [Myxococcota bacterium]
MSSSSPLKPGDQIGKYVVRERIGNGATAHVYEAEHERLGHVVAIKVLRPVMVAKIQGRFDRETRALAAIHSRHVPQVHDVGTLPNGTPYVVMERLHGQTLAEHIQEHGRLAVDEALDLGVQLAAALEATHLAGWIHRDVKPSNLVLHEESDGRQVLKLCDFGVCTPVAKEKDAGLTLNGQTVGTPEHMSPEQARGLPLDPRSDVFAAGTVLHEMLIGYSPFERPGANAHVVAMAVTRDPVESLRAKRDDVPLELDTLILKTLEKDPEARPRSATVLREQLERLAAKAPRPTRAVPRVKAAALPMVGRGLGRAALGVAAAAAVGLFGYLWVDVGPAGASAPDDEPLAIEAEVEPPRAERQPSAAEIAVANLRPPRLSPPSRPLAASDLADEPELELPEATETRERDEPSTTVSFASSRRRHLRARRAMSDPEPAPEGVSLSEVNQAIDRALERNPELTMREEPRPERSARSDGAARRLGSPRAPAARSVPASPYVTVPESPYRDRRVAEARPVPGNPF